VGSRARPPNMHLPGVPYLAPGTWAPSLALLAISGIALFAIIGNVSIGPVGRPNPPSGPGEAALATSLTAASANWEDAPPTGP
jgi:hypothetical protein